MKWLAVLLLGGLLTMAQYFDPRFAGEYTPGTQGDPQARAESFLRSLGVPFTPGDPNNYRLAENIRAGQEGSVKSNFAGIGGDLLGGIATAGLSEAAQSLASGRPGVALNQLGPYGAAVQPTLGTAAAQTGNLAGVGAGLAAGGLESVTPSGFGAAPAGPTPFETAATQLGFSPSAIQEGSTALAGGPIFGGGVQYAPSFGPGSGGAGLGGGGGVAQLGGNLGLQAANLLGGLGQPPSMIPGMFPGGGGAGGAQGLSQAQMAALSADQSQRGPRAIDPPFIARMTGKGESPGLASPQDLSLAALYGLGGQQ